MKNLFVLFGFGLLLASCGSQTDQVNRAFSQEPNWLEIAQKWSSSTKARKTLLKDGVHDTIYLDSISWVDELKVVTDLSWNTEANAAKYNIDSSSLSLAKTKRYTIRAIDTNQLVRLAEFTYQDNKLIEAAYLVKEDNPVYGFNRLVHIIPSEKIEVRVVQEVTQLMNEAFSVTIEALPLKQKFMGYLQREDGIQLPIRFYVDNDEFVIVNGAEQIAITAQRVDDSLILKMPVFPTEFHLKETDEGYVGKWYNKDGSGYQLPFTAEPIPAFEDQKLSLSSYYPPLSGEWHTTFIRPTKRTEALGIFEQGSSKLYGTFMTRSGDYRSLQGSWDRDSFHLSAFDGSHAYLFTGRLVDGKITGDWYSGKSFHITWEAKRDDTFKLPQADTLTYLKDGHETITFSFPDTSGNLVSLTDDRYQGKPVIVTIMGSWCPNCMDEARYFKEIYPEYHAKGLEIIGLSFERSGEFERDLPAIKKAIADLDIDYTVLHAGKAGGKYAAEALPMLNHVISFPTSIYINRAGKVVKIHTGFSGPGTGKRYDEFIAENARFLEEFVR